MKTTRQPFLLLPLLVLALITGCQTDSQLYSPTGPVIAAIETDLAANRLTRPTGNNAMEKIDRLALIAPDDPRIQEYRNQVTVQLISLGQKAFVDGRLYRAKLLALRAMEIDPHNAEAGYILNAVAEANRPAQLNEAGQFQPTEPVAIEQVQDSNNVETTIISPVELQSTHSTPGK